VLEVQREAAIAAAAGLDPTAVAEDDPNAGETEAASPGVAAAAAAAAEAATAAALAADEFRKAEALEQSAEGPDEPEEPEAVAASPAHTQSIPVVDLEQMEVAELGLADRLGLGETDPDDEVGPTS
jgi:cell division transport system ATP-binding protein